MSGWICVVCEGPAKSCLIEVGAYCGPACRKKLLARRRSLHRRLLAEAAGQCHDSLDVPAFDRFALKWALHMIRRRKQAGKPAVDLSPEDVAADLKSEILRHVPREFVTQERARGHERMFCAGTFTFTKPLPEKVLEEALVKAGLARRTARAT